MPSCCCSFRVRKAELKTPRKEARFHSEAELQLTLVSGKRGIHATAKDELQRGPDPETSSWVDKNKHGRAPAVARELQASSREGLFYGDSCSCEHRGLGSGDGWEELRGPFDLKAQSTRGDLKFREPKGCILIIHSLSLVFLSTPGIPERQEDSLIAGQV